MARPRKDADLTRSGGESERGGGSGADHIEGLREGDFVASLERGLSVLRAFSRERPAMTLSEIAVVTDLSAAVVRRCLNTLSRLDYVTKRGRTFQLRPRVVEFGTAFVESTGLDSIAYEPLQHLRDTTGDSTSLSVLAGRDILYLIHFATSRRIRLTAGVGTRYPAYATSMGRAMMAFQEPAELEQTLKDVSLERLTRFTVSNKKDLRKILTDARKNGFAATQDELDYGLVSIAVPILAQDRRVVAAINCSTSTSRVDREEMIKTRLPLLREAAATIEDEIKRYPVLARSLGYD